MKVPPAIFDNSEKSGRHIAQLGVGPNEATENCTKALSP